MTSDTESESGEKGYTSEHFKEAVKEFIRIHDRLAEIRRDTSMLNKRKKKLTEGIISFMSKNEKEFCNLGNEGTLEMKKSKSTLALKKDQIEELMKLYGKSEVDAKSIATFLWENKTTKERSVLKRNVKPLQ